MAKLAPATCPKCGAHLQLDPAREFVTCQYCGASSFIETEKRPVTQYVQAQHLPVIHIQHAQRGCAKALAVFAAIAAIGVAIAGGLAAYLMRAGDSALSPALPLPVASDRITSTDNGEAEPAPGKLVEEDYFADATRVKARYEAVLGKPIQAKQLLIYRHYAFLEAQDPKNADHVDRYKLWANQVERPEPVRLGSNKNSLQQILFSLDTVDFSIVPRLTREALAQLQIEEGKVTHVYLERHGFGAKREPVWRVYVNGSRESGFIEFSLTGEQRRIAK